MIPPYDFYQRLNQQGPRTLCEKIVFRGLIGLSWLYGCLVRLRLVAYDKGILRRYRATIPVISVGNLTVGGTGKTPVVDDLVRRCLANGKRVAVISRGYRGKREAATALVSDGDKYLLKDPQRYGDEPVLLAIRNPEAIVIVAQRRSEGVILAEKMGAELAILDDGFQHLRLERDLDIVLLDSDQPFGNRHYFPAGLLREPVSALQRADLLVFTRFRGQDFPDFNVVKPVVFCRQCFGRELYSLDGATMAWSQLRNFRCVAFAGIAYPEKFFQQLEDRDVILAEKIALHDHQEFDQKRLRSLRKACQQADICLTTEKDAIKLKSYDLPVPCFVVPLEISFQPESLLKKVLEPYFR